MRAINASRISQLKSQAAAGARFRQARLLPRPAAHRVVLPGVGQPRRDGVGNYLSFGDFPQDPAGNVASFYLPRGVVTGNNLAAPPQPLDQNQIKEYVTRSWYSYARAATGSGCTPARARPRPTTPGHSRSMTSSTWTASTRGSRRRATTTSRWRWGRSRAWSWPTRPAIPACANWSTACLRKLRLPAGCALLHHRPGRRARHRNAWCSPSSWGAGLASSRPT